MQIDIPHFFRDTPVRPDRTPTRPIHVALIRVVLIHDALTHFASIHAVPIRVTRARCARADLGRNAIAAVRFPHAPDGGAQ